MNKRFIILASVGALILLVGGGLLYWASQKQNQAKPSSAGPTLKKVLDEQVIAPVPAFNNSSIWYFNRQGQLFRVNIDGSGLSEFPLPALLGNLHAVLWPKVGTDFLAMSFEGTQDQIQYYNNTSKIYINLPSNIQSIDWMPDGQRVLYIWKSSDNQHQSLILANADGTGFTTIKDVFWPDLIVKASPDGTKALLYRSTIEGDVNKIYLVDIMTGEITVAVDAGKNLEAKWLSADKFVYAQSTGKAFAKVFLYDMTAKSSLDLNLMTGLDKILADQQDKFIYASVPKSDNSGDTFIKLDLSSLKQEVYFQPTTAIRGVNLMLLGNTLYFVNSSDGKLYSIEK